MPANLTDEELVDLIAEIQDELPCYGYRRVTHELYRRGHLVNHQRVARVRKVNGLGIEPRRRYIRSTDSSHDSPIYPNLYCIETFADVAEMKSTMSNSCIRR
jgi:putative transposase